jgi:hypothetical protein
MSRSLLAPIRALASVLLFALSSAGCTRSHGLCVDDPNAQSTQEDGACCVYSINCQPGSICNTEMNDLFDGAKPSAVCVRVACLGDADCSAPKKCGLTRVCEAPACRADAECAVGSICLRGACAIPPNAAAAAYCRVVVPRQVVVEGQPIELSALAFDARGDAISGIRFAWTSGDPEIARVYTSSAAAGAKPGEIELAAAVVGNSTVSCAGPMVANVPRAPAGALTVIAADEASGAPIAGARVSIEGSDPRASTTDPSGAAVFAGLARPESITIIAGGFATVSILSPGTSNLYVPLPRLSNRATSGGIRGSVVLSDRRRDIELGFVGRPLPAGLLDVGRTQLFGEPVRTTVLGSLGCSCTGTDEAGLPTKVQLAASGYLLEIGNKQVSDDHADPGGGIRCQAAAPPAGGIGCDVVELPAGLSAAWTIAGSISLSSVTSIATDLARLSYNDVLLAPDAETDLPIQHLLVFGSIFAQLSHGASPLLEAAALPRVQVDRTRTDVDCTDPIVSRDPVRCRGDFGRYRHLDLTADAPMVSRSIVRVPDLPSTRTGGCPDAAILIAAARLPGRGLLPLGIASGLDVPAGGSSDCRIGGAKRPFGDLSAPLEDGFMPLSVAPLHGGLEGSALMLLLFAVESKPPLRRGAPLSVLVACRLALDGEESLADPGWVAHPSAAWSAADATVSFDDTPSDATLVRLDVETARGRWLVHAPADRGQIALPEEPEARAVLAAPQIRSAVTRIRSDVPYADLWALEGKPLADHIIAFTEQPCAADGRCAAE